jgi:uncharacterized membrane protein YcaP (DUF421 family)
MEIIVRATVIFFFLWALMRVTGRRELSQMTAFELVLLIVMGDLIQQGVTQEDMSITGAMLAVGTMAAWVLVTSFLGFRFPRTRPVLEGLPVVVVREGEVLQKALDLERVTLDELIEEARNNGIPDLADIELAVLEPDGKFSFLQRAGQGSQQSGEEQGPPA